MVSGIAQSKLTKRNGEGRREGGGGQHTRGAVGPPLGGLPPPHAQITATLTGLTEQKVGGDGADCIAQQWEVAPGGPPTTG